MTYMSPQARRRLHRSVTPTELEDLAHEIADAINTHEGYVIDGVTPLLHLSLVVLSALLDPH